MGNTLSSDWISTNETNWRMRTRDNLGRFTPRARPIRPQGRFTPEKSYLLGTLGPGDGYVLDWKNRKKGTYRKALGLKATDLDFVLEFKRCLIEVYGLRVKWSIIPVDPYQTQYRCELCSNLAVDDILKYGPLKSFKEGSEEIPQVIRDSESKPRHSYLRAVFDSQGHIGSGIVLYKNETSLLKSIQELLATDDIESKVYQRHTRNAGMLYIQKKKNIARFLRLIGFSIKRKQKSLRRLSKVGVREYRKSLS